MAFLWLANDGQFIVVFGSSLPSSTKNSWTPLTKLSGSAHGDTRTHTNQEIENSKWVWSGNTTITNRRQPCDIARKSRSSITRHQEDKLSKATSSLFPSQDDCNTRTDTKQRTTKHITITDSENGSNNEQNVNNNRTTALERTSA